MLFYASDTNHNYAERVLRTLASVGGVRGLNQAGIKVDVFTVLASDDGPQVYANSPVVDLDEETHVGSLDEFLQWLQLSKYDQVVHSHARPVVTTVSVSEITSEFLAPGVLVEGKAAATAAAVAMGEALELVKETAIELMAAKETEDFDPSEIDWDNNKEDDDND